MIKVLPLKGYNSLKALNAFNALLLGLKMMPAYSALSYEEFFDSFKEKSESERETALREAVAFVELQQDEVEAIVSFTCDPNGVPYRKENIKSLDVKQLHELIVAVCMEIGRIDITIVSEDEKKKSQDLA